MTFTQAPESRHTEIVRRPFEGNTRRPAFGSVAKPCEAHPSSQLKAALHNPARSLESRVDESRIAVIPNEVAFQADSGISLTTGASPRAVDSAKSFLRNTLLANPLLPRFYRGRAQSMLPNQKKTSILWYRYRNIFPGVSYRFVSSNPLSPNILLAITFISIFCRPSPHYDPSKSLQSNNLPDTDQNYFHSRIPSLPLTLRGRTMSPSVPSR